MKPPAQLQISALTHHLHFIYPWQPHWISSQFQNQENTFKTAENAAANVAANAAHLTLLHMQCNYNFSITHHSTQHTQPLLTQLL